ncbi:MAG: hypothetical protein K8T10_01930 [Candidatus Eremiobacteraeota bacterium]|nr:hypothetical protein [Candidatus Eremiobacteraeota bacterium]
MLSFRDIEEEIYSLRKKDIDPTFDVLAKRLSSKKSNKAKQIIQLAIDSGDLIKEGERLRFPNDEERMQQAQDFCELLGV